MTYIGVRNELGRIILLGLEILIIADIIQTITVDLTLTNAATLGVIVLVRTFLSFSLEIELEGAPPWRRLELARAVGAPSPIVQRRGHATEMVPRQQWVRRSSVLIMLLGV